MRVSSCRKSWSGAKVAGSPRESSLVLSGEGLVALSSRGRLGVACIASKGRDPAPAAPPLVSSWVLRDAFIRAHTGPSGGGIDEGAPGQRPATPSAPEGRKELRC